MQSLAILRPLENRASVAGGASFPGSASLIDINLVVLLQRSFNNSIAGLAGDGWPIVGQLACPTCKVIS